jgi:DeoR family glycerol-3-phosphate regulon repressor
LQIRSFRAHHAILTIGTLDSRTRVMDFNIDEAQVAQAMLNQAESLTIFVDSL